MDPQIYELLRTKKPGEMVKRGPYLYWKSTRSEVARRVWVEDYERVGKKGSWQERAELYRQLMMEEAVPSR